MENLSLSNPEIQDLLGIGAFLVVNGAIALNRLIIRKAVNNPYYDRISLQVEHVAHHATLPLMVTPFIKDVVNDQLGAAALGVYVSAAKGFMRDVVFTRPGMDFTVFPLRPQVDQFASDVAGCLLYLAAATALNS